MSVASARPRMELHARGHVPDRSRKPSAPRAFAISFSFGHQKCLNNHGRLCHVERCWVIILHAVGVQAVLLLVYACCVCSILGCPQHRILAIWPCPLGRAVHLMGLPGLHEAAVLVSLTSRLVLKSLIRPAPPALRKS